MQHERVYSSHQLWRWIWLLIVPFALLGTTCCCTAWNVVFPAETRAPETFPETDIVFVASGKDIGFINADGTGLSYEHLVVNVYGNSGTVWPWRPAITGDSRMLIVKMADHVARVSRPELLALWQVNKFPVVCGDWLYQQAPLLTLDQRKIFIQEERGVAIYMLESCGTEEEPLQVLDGIFGVPSPDLNYVAYVNRDLGWDDQRFIVIREMSSGVERTIGMGDYPAWSRDSHWLVYTGTDGLYLLNVAGIFEPVRLILLPNPYPGWEDSPLYVGATTWGMPPEVSWSPDGRWLVYHKWRGTEHTDDAASPSDYAIYKLNIETGEEIKIIDGGMYPYWRWPAKQPGE